MDETTASVREDLPNTLDATLCQAVEEIPHSGFNIKFKRSTRREADSFIDSFGDEMRTAASAGEAISRACAALQVRGYRSGWSMILWLKWFWLKNCGFWKERPVSLVIGCFNLKN